MPKDHLTKLSFSSLDYLSDGQVAVAVDQAIKSAIADLKAWGSDGKIRKVVVEVGLSNKKKGDKYKVGVNVKVLLPTDKPKYTLAELTMERGEPEMFFNKSSANNLDQMRLFDEVVDAGAEAELDKAV